MEGLMELVTEICIYAFNVGFVFALGAKIVRFFIDTATGRRARL